MSFPPFLALPPPSPPTTSYATQHFFSNMKSSDLIIILIAVLFPPAVSSRSFSTQIRDGVPRSSLKLIFLPSFASFFPQAAAMISGLCSCDVLFVPPSSSSRVDELSDASCSLLCDRTCSINGQTFLRLPLPSSTSAESRFFFLQVLLTLLGVIPGHVSPKICEHILRRPSF